MSLRTEWEILVTSALAELSAGLTTLSLYGAGHPRAARAVTDLLEQLQQLFGNEAELTLVVVGEELFVDGRPFTRSSRHAPGVIRRLRRRGLQHVAFRQGVTAEELRGFLVDLAASDDSPVTSRPHVQVGTIELADRDVGGPDAAEAGRRGKLPTVRDRVEVLLDAFRAFATGRVLPVAELETVCASLLAALDGDPDPLHHLAAWQGPERWPAVHAHNVAAVALGLARLAGIGRSACVELGVGALLHDVAKVFLPPEVLEREILLPAGEVELILDHPKDGLDVLLTAGQLPPLALVLVYEHHLSFNGTGYPRLPRPRRPHPAAALLAVADTFDGLFTARAGQALLTREATVALLKERAGTALDPGWTGALVELLEGSSSAVSGSARQLDG